MLLLMKISACLKRRTEAYRGILDIFECLHTLDEEKANRLIKEYSVHIDVNKVRTHTFENVCKERRNNTGKDI